MRRTLTQTLVAVALVALTAVPVLAQATLNRTSFSAAVNATQTTVPLTSASTVVAGHELFADGEAMLVLTTPTDTNVQVRRGYDGTGNAPHAASTLVYTGTPSRFLSRDPVPGSCTPSTVTSGALPAINVRNSTVWDCAATTSGFRWQASSLIPQFEMAPRTVVAGNVSAVTGGYTVVLSDYIVALSTTGTGTGGLAAPVTTFYLPSPTGLAGKVLIFKDESGGIGATTFINLMGSVDGATSFQLKTAFGGVSLYAGSGGWFTFSCWAAGCR